MPAATKAAHNAPVGDSVTKGWWSIRRSRPRTAATLMPLAPVPVPHALLGVKERAQRRRRFHPGQHLAHRALPQRIHVVDAVRPVTIPATIEATFAAASTRAPPGTVTIRSTKDSSPVSRANRITGTNTAEGTRFTSSKVAENLR